MPDLDYVEGHQDGEHEGASHLHVLGKEQEVAALDAVGYDAAEQREEKDGKAGEDLIQSRA